MKKKKSRDMIKDFNSFITEDKEYTEIFTLVEEVLSNDYSNREIEESFDEFNLLLESISMDDIKKYVNIAKSDENLQKLFKMRDDFKKDYDSLEKELIKSLEDKKISREEFREKLQAAYKEYQDCTCKVSYSYIHTSFVYLSAHSQCTEAVLDSLLCLDHEEVKL